MCSQLCCSDRWPRKNVTFLVSLLFQISSAFQSEAHCQEMEADVGRGGLKQTRAERSSERLYYLQPLWICGSCPLRTFMGQERFLKVSSGIWAKAKEEKPRSGEGGPSNSCQKCNSAGRSHQNYLDILMHAWLFFRSSSQQRSRRRLCRVRNCSVKLQPDLRDSCCGREGKRIEGDIVVEHKGKRRSTKTVQTYQWQAAAPQK